MDSNSSTDVMMRFDDAREDATRRYGKWRKWAKAYLTLLEAKGSPKETHGSALFCLLDGPAELALEGLNFVSWMVPIDTSRASMNGSRTSRHTTRLANHWMTSFTWKLTRVNVLRRARAAVESSLRRRHERELSCWRCSWLLDVAWRGAR